MKIAYKLSFVLCLGALLYGCETYGDPDVGYTAVAPLDGQWECFLYDYNQFQSSGENAPRLQFMELYSSATTNNDSDKIWFNMVFPLSPVNKNLISSGYPTEILSIKVDCNPRQLSFAVSNAQGYKVPPTVFNSYLGGGVNASTAMEDWVASILDGKVERNAIVTPSSQYQNGKEYYTDKISFGLELDNPIDGVSKFMVVGGRFTGWEDDYYDLTEFLENQFDEFYGD